MLDANFDGKIQTTDFRGYNDWANTDFRQVGATGSVLLGPGGLFTGPGGLFTGPGGLFTGPGGLFTGPGGFFTGPGGLFTGPGGLFTGPGGLFTGPGTSGGEIDLATAISVVHAPGALTATEDPSPRVIHLSWTAPTFFDKFNIYKSSDNGASFSFFTSTTDTFKDDPVTCNPNGYKYFVTVVALNTTLTPPQNQESTPSNTAPTTTPPRLTGCYTNTPNTFPTPPLTDLAFSTNTNPTVQGDHVFITWTLQVDNPASYENPSVTYVSNKAANTLSAIGPFPNNQGCGLSVPAGTQVTKLLSEGAVQKQSSTDASAFDFNNSTNQFTFTWDTTPFNAGCYLFKLDLDSKTQSETTGTPPNTATALTLLIFVSDNVPHMITTSLPDGVVGSAYPNTTLQEAGGIGPTFTWCVVVPGSCVNSVSPLPPGISLGLHSGTLSGAPTAPGIYSFVVKVTDDSTGNFGTQTLTLRVADALFGDLIVVDGSPSANPLAGTLFRITPTGTWGTIAPILDGN